MSLLADAGLGLKIKVAMIAEDSIEAKSIHVRVMDGVAELEKESGIAIAVENMYPWRAAGREIAAYAPDWDPTDEPYAHNTLDLSHTAVSGSDAMAMADALGDRLAPTAPARPETSIWCRGVATNRAQPCSSAWSGADGAGRSCWRSELGGLGRPRSVRPTSPKGWRSPG